MCVGRECCVRISRERDVLSEILARGRQFLFFKNLFKFNKTLRLVFFSTFFWKFTRNVQHVVVKTLKIEFPAVAIPSNFEPSERARTLKKKIKKFQKGRKWRNGGVMPGGTPLEGSPTNHHTSPPFERGSKWRHLCLCLRNTAPCWLPMAKGSHYSHFCHLNFRIFFSLEYKDAANDYSHCFAYFDLLS